MPHSSTRPRASAAALPLGERLLQAIDTARWDDGTRIVDVDPTVIRQRLLPTVIDALSAHHRRQLVRAAVAPTQRGLQARPLATRRGRPARPSPTVLPRRPLETR